MQSKTDMAILGMLTIEPMSGYDMKQFCEESISFFWYETFGNLYPRLKLLSKRGLIKGKRERRERGPDATIYSLTATGRREFREWLKQPPDQEHVRSEFMLKFFFGSHASAETTEHRLAEYEEQQKKMLKQYKQIDQVIQAVPNEHKDAFFWRMSVRRGQLLARARLKWCRECRSEFEQLKLEGGSK